MSDTDRAARWRLVLGEPATGSLGPPSTGEAEALDRALEAVYGGKRRGGLGASAPGLVRWLGEVRAAFPAPVVQVLQRDALERLGLTQLLLEPEVLASLEPDAELVATLLTLARAMPDRARETARELVARLTARLRRALTGPMVGAVRGAIARGARTRRPRPADVDWPRTVQANLGRWRPGRGLVVERWVGHGRRVRGLHDVVLCVDQSGSMATSVLHAAVAGSVLAGLPALRTRLAVFDTAVIDLTEVLADPVDVLFGAQLGGGTDLDVALAWCQSVVERPARTVVVLVSDLGHGGDPASFRARAAALFASGVTGVVLLAISDEGRPSYDAEHAAFFASLGVPCVAVTPAELPDLLGVALRRGDVGAWVGGNRDAAR